MRRLSHFPHPSSMRKRGTEPRLAQRPCFSYHNPTLARLVGPTGQGTTFKSFADISFPGGSKRLVMAILSLLLWRGQNFPFAWVDGSSSALRGPCSWPISESSHMHEVCRVRLPYLTRAVVSYPCCPGKCGAAVSEAQY